MVLLLVDVPLTGSKRLKSFISYIWELGKLCSVWYLFFHLQVMGRGVLHVITLHLSLISLPSRKSHCGEKGTWWGKACLTRLPSPLRGSKDQPLQRAHWNRLQKRRAGRAAALLSRDSQRVCTGVVGGTCELYNIWRGSCFTCSCCFW